MLLAESNHFLQGQMLFFSECTNRMFCLLFTLKMNTLQFCQYVFVYTHIFGLLMYKGCLDFNFMLSLSYLLSPLLWIYIYIFLACFIVQHFGIKNDTTIQTITYVHVILSKSKLLSINLYRTAKNTTVHVSLARMLMCPLCYDLDYAVFFGLLPGKKWTLFC